MAQAFGELDVNDIRMRIHAHGGIGTSGTGPWSDGFEVPVGGGTSTLYAAGLWFTGITTSGSMRVAAHMYNSSIGRDFFPGPLRADGSASLDPAVSQQFDQVWSVTREEIITHQTYFTCLDDPDCDVSIDFPIGYSVPDAILEWPAMNPAQGHDPFLAPYFDRDGDGSYDPMAGDTPCILGDKALFVVYNDMLEPHGLSSGEGVGLEVQVMPFAYTGHSLALDQTVFLRYRVINRSTTVYENALVGSFNDFVIGCPNDDFIGTDPSRNLFYAYNQTDTDEDCGMTQGYGGSPPAFGMAVLKGPPVDTDGMDTPEGNLLPAWNGQGFGDGIVDNERHGLSRTICPSCQGPGVFDPTQDLHFDRFMRGQWVDGTLLSYGGSGYSLSPTAVQSHFIFPGSDDPVGAGTNGDPQTPWLDGEQVVPIVGRAGVNSMGPFTFEPGEHLDLLFAYVYARSNDGALASVAALQARTDSVIAFAQTLPIWDMADNASWSLQCEDYLNVAIAERQQRTTLALYPSPTPDAFHFDAPQALAGAVLVVRDVTGREVLRQGLVAGLNRVDLQGAKPGVYICEAATAKGRYTGRVVKE